MRIVGTQKWRRARRSFDRRLPKTKAAIGCKRSSVLAVVGVESNMDTNFATHLLGGNSIGFLGPKIGPIISPKTNPRRNLKRIHTYM